MGVRARNKVARFLWFTVYVYISFCFCVNFLSHVAAFLFVITHLHGRARVL